MAYDMTIICNYQKCRKRLTSSAWVTKCSHAFCEEDGHREFNNSNEEKKCPACSSILNPQNYEIVKVDLNPSEQFKSMVLSGMNPEIILDVCSRAITFWNYQMYQESLYQSACVKKTRETVQELETFYENQVASLKTELGRGSKKLRDAKNEEKQLSLRLNDEINSLQRRSLSSSVSDLLPEKHREFSRSFAAARPSASNTFASRHNFTVGLQTLADTTQRQKLAQTYAKPPVVRQSPAFQDSRTPSLAQGFNFTPASPLFHQSDHRRKRPYSNNTIRNKQ
ncbi:unnamed protein product [Timema podura]|uniref:Cyclin B1 interacting protein 1 n=1 Tax=Timema podura TaxID=61482 RepID=A0ABN7NYX1_TIMPD|nr:unnamed protein product [Timema podura]